MYINTEKPFPSFRFNELVECYKEKYNIDIDLQKNVFLQHISNYSQIKKTLHVLLPHFLTYNDVGLIIIDSIAGIFRTEEEDVVYTNRTQQFIDIVTKLNQLSKSFNICIVCVNHVSVTSHLYSQLFGTELILGNRQFKYLRNCPWFRFIMDQLSKLQI